jgi:RNA polymerase sigma factor (TIGR02999 family)
MDENDEFAAQMIHDLRRYAAGMMRRLQYGITLQPTELVNMAFLKLHGKEQLASGDFTGEVFGLYVTTMKHVLRDHLRKRKREKRGGGASRIDVEILAELEQAGVDPKVFLEFLDELEAMGQKRREQVMIARVFYKLTNEEIAAQLGVSVGTIEDDMRQAKEWLRKRIHPDA